MTNEKCSLVTNGKVCHQAIEMGTCPGYQAGECAKLPPVDWYPPRCQTKQFMSRSIGWYGSINAGQEDRIARTCLHLRNRIANVKHKKKVREYRLQNKK